MACCGFCGFDWTHGGNAPWYEVQDTCPDGTTGTVIRAGVIGDSQTSVLISGEFNNTSGVISFKYKVSSESGFDGLRVEVISPDGSLVSTALPLQSGNIGWTTSTFDPASLSAGIYQLRFTYLKDGSASEGSDTAWLTDISGLPSTAGTASVNAALRLSAAFSAETDLREAALASLLRLSAHLAAAPGRSASASLRYPLRLRSAITAARGLAAAVRPTLRLRASARAAASAASPTSTARFPVWLEIDDAPTAAFWREPAASKLHGAALGWPVLSSVGTLHQPLIRPGLGGGESGNATVTLDDATGLLARRWATPPIRRTARVQCPAGTLLAGMVTAWTAGARTSVQIDGGQVWALTDPLPLRTSAVWGAWKAVETLPLIYGQATIRPVQYDQQGKVFLLADHPIAGVDGVTRDDVPSNAWAHHNAVDSTGRPCAFIELATPLAQGERLAVAVRGKLHPVTGQPIDLPHALLTDLVGTVLGLPLQPGSLDLLRTQFADWHIGAVFAETKMTQREAIDAVCQSLGAAWSAGSTDFARQWPDTPQTQATVSVTPLTARDVQASCQHSDIATVLRVLYDQDNATGQPRRAVQLAAPEAISRYGRIEREWQAPFLRSPRQAQQLGQRLLAWLSTPVYTVTWTMADQALTVGDAVLLAHPGLPVSGPALLTDVQRDLSRATLTLQTQVASGPAPAIVIERLSSSFDPIIASGTTVEYANGKAVFTLLGDNGKPLAGAKVILDGKTVRYADGAGRVTFEAERGAHKLHILATGYAPMDIDVTV